MKIIICPFCDTLLFVNPNTPCPNCGKVQCKNCNLKLNKYDISHSIICKHCDKDYRRKCKQNLKTLGFERAKPVKVEKENLKAHIIIYTIITNTK